MPPGAERFEMSSGLVLVAAAVASLSYSNWVANYHPVAGKQTQFEANVKLPNGSYQRMIVNADNISNAKAMLQQQYCPEKKNCVVSGPHPAH